MKKLLFLFTILLLISCSNTIEADAKKYCELIQKLAEMEQKMTILPWDDLSLNNEELLFRSYKRGSFEFKDYETNESILISTDSLSNYEFIHHPSFITTVANNFEFKEEYEDLSGLIEEEIVNWSLIEFERIKLREKYTINGGYSEGFFELTHHCFLPHHY